MGSRGRRRPELFFHLQKSLSCVFSACGCWIFHWMGLYSVRLLASSRASRNLFLILLGGISGFGRELIVDGERKQREDRKSTRLNSSHLVISYAVFCLKKKKKVRMYAITTRRNDSYHANSVLAI